jgi:hypothetical protein
MTTYEYHGSIRIEANSEDEANNLLDRIEREMNCEIHINDMEEVD